MQIAGAKHDHHQHSATSSNKDLKNIIWMRFLSEVINGIQLTEYDLTFSIEAKVVVHSS